MQGPDDVDVGDRAGDASDCQGGTYARVVQYRTRYHQGATACQSDCLQIEFALTQFHW